MQFGDYFILPQDARITDCSVAASYNWIASKHPRMLVPGTPPRWTPLAEPIKLPEDEGDFLRDRNAAQYPNHPMEPAIVAALEQSPDLCGDRKIDLVACNSTLGNLLRWLRGEDKPFRILVEKVGDTVFFTRREKSPTEKIPDVRGFGHSFPEHYTTWDPDAKGSTSHQRLLRYCFGGLRCFVRFEADGYVAEDSNKTGTKMSQSPSAVATALDLLDSMNSVTIASEDTTPGGALQVQLGGSNVGQNQIFDLKTRSVRKKEHDTLNEELPRLWFSQLDKFILAYHTDGLFEDIRVMNVRADIERWERQEKETLLRLASLIHRIRDTVTGRPSGKLEICHTGDKAGVLQFREQLPGVGDALSAEIKSRWEEEDGECQSRSDEESDVSLGDIGWDDGEEDYTTCSAACDYCGRCGGSRK